MNFAVTFFIVTPEGFEPSPPKRTQLKCVALDHSAIASKWLAKYANLKPPAGLEPAALRLKV